MGESNLSITKDLVRDFSKVQKYMFLAKKENATETYEELKNEYIDLKAILTAAGVNITELDKIKE